MRLFGIRFDDRELYFQLEKRVESLNVLNLLARMLFGEAEFFFDVGLSEKDVYIKHEQNGVYTGMVMSEDRIHLIIRGIDEQIAQKIKSLIFEKYEFVKTKPDGAI